MLVALLALCLHTAHAAVKWVLRDAVPLLDCPIQFDNRTDVKLLSASNRGGNCEFSSLQKWHAILTAPDGSDIPSSVLVASPALDGKIIFIVGDSLAGGQFNDIVCSLHAHDHKVTMVMKNREDPALIGALIAEVSAADGTTFWVVYNSFGNLHGGGRQTEAYATRSIAKVKSYIASKKSAYRGIAPRGAIVQMTSVKAHSLKSHGYGRVEDGPAAYFRDLLSFKEHYSKVVDAELFYYRPAFATHFATSDAGFIPNSAAAQLPCTRIDSSVNLTSQKSFFLKEEGQLEQRSKDDRFFVIPDVWAMSVDMWFLHPALTHAVHSPGKAVSDCLHFCNLGNGYHGIYEAANRWFWWHMLNRVARGSSDQPVA